MIIRIFYHYYYFIIIIIIKGVVDWMQKLLQQPRRQNLAALHLAFMAAYVGLQMAKASPVDRVQLKILF